MKLDLNFNLKNPDGTDIFESYRENDKEKSKTIPAKTIVSNFLISASKHEKLSEERAWDFAVQLAKDGTINAEITSLDELWNDIDKSGFSILVKRNIKNAIEKVKEESKERIN